MFAAFEVLFERLNSDMNIRAAVLTGAGSAFCSGGNVAEMRDRTGMFGGSREAVGRALADRNYRETAASTAGNMLNTLYGNQVQAWAAEQQANATSSAGIGSMVGTIAGSGITY